MPLRGAERRQAAVAHACRDELDRPESWLDRTHSYLNQRLCAPAAWFDGFFGDPRAFEETPAGSFFRLRNSLRWDQTEDLRYRLRVQASIALPQASDRLRLLLSRSEDLRGEGEAGGNPGLDDEDADTRLGLRLIASDRLRSRFDVDGTVRLSGGTPNPRLRGRYRHAIGLGERRQARLTQSLFWEADESLGSTTRVDFEWLPDRDTLLRQSTEGTWTRDAGHLRWRSGVTAFHQLSRRTALRGDVGVFGDTGPEAALQEIFIAVAYRRMFLRHWLFYELQPQRAWPQDADGNRRGDWRFTFTVEVQFENEPSRQARLRRYLGEQAGADDAAPVPVDAPGERAIEAVEALGAPDTPDAAEGGAAAPPADQGDDAADTSAGPTPPAEGPAEEAPENRPRSAPPQETTAPGDASAL